MVFFFKSTHIFCHRIQLAILCYLSLDEKLLIENYISSVTITFFILPRTSPLPVTIRENRYAFKYKLQFLQIKLNRSWWHMKTIPPNHHPEVAEFRKDTVRECIWERAGCMISSALSISCWGADTFWSY